MLPQTLQEYAQTLHTLSNNSAPIVTESPTYNINQARPERKCLKEIVLENITHFLTKQKYLEVAFLISSFFYVLHITHDYT